MLPNDVTHRISPSLAIRATPSRSRWSAIRNSSRAGGIGQPYRREIPRHRLREVRPVFLVTSPIIAQARTSILVGSRRLLIICSRISDRATILKIDRPLECSSFIHQRVGTAIYRGSWLNCFFQAFSTFSDSTTSSPILLWRLHVINSREKASLRERRAFPNMRNNGHRTWPVTSVFCLGRFRSFDRTPG